MAIDQESFNKRLYDIFKTRGYKPAPKDSKNERTNPETADVFEFQFIKDGENYGKAWATIDKTSSLNIYYDDNQAGSPPGQTKGVDYDDSWSGLLKHLKQWALSKQLNFGLHDSDRLGDDMRQRDYYKMKEKMNEGYHAVNKRTSYNDNIPNVKVVIQHDRQIGEGEQRWRNVHKIFVENTEGERFAVPTRMPGIARVYGRHVAEGGTPYDDRGKHITALVEEYTKMAGFVRATRRGEFNESVAKLIAEGVQHHKSLKETLQKMQSHRGYNHYFESWTPPLMEDESDHTSIAEMFAQESIDPRIESVLPILNKLNSNIINEIEEVNELDQWAKGITEITEEVIEEEKRDTHCSAKCCGADVKAEDCGCPADCPHCNCNAKLEENISDNKEPTIDQEMDSYFGSKPGHLEEAHGLADKVKMTKQGEGIADEQIYIIHKQTTSQPKRIQQVQKAQELIRKRKLELQTEDGFDADTNREWYILIATEQRYNAYLAGDTKPLTVNVVDDAFATAEKELSKDKTDITPLKKSSLSLPGMIAKGMELANPYNQPRQPNIDPKDRRVAEEKDNKGFTDKEIKMAFGIANDKRYKDGNMSGAIKAIEGIKKGLSDHPSVKNVLEKTQGLQETKSGGQTFAGNYKTGKAGQWRNTGPTKGRPAKVGDLVGAESAEPKKTMLEDEEYDALSDGDIITLRNGDEYTISHNSDGTISAVADEGTIVIDFDELKDQVVDYGDPSDRKDHRPDNMPTEGIGGQVGQFMDEITADEPEDVYEADNSALVKRAMERFKGIDKEMAQRIANAVKPKGTINSKLYVELGDLYDKKDMKGVDALLKEAFAWDELDEAENSPDGNVGADDDGNNDKYNQNANQVQDRKSIQEGDDLLAIIRNIKI